MHFFSGLIGVAIGFLLVRYSVALTHMFGSIPWAEEHLRGGFAGTYTFYRLLGLIFILLSFLYMFNIIGFLLAPLGPIFGGARPINQ